MNIVELLKSEEGKTLEFKRDLSSPKNLLKTLVAFANTAGGQMIVGVDDRTRLPVGVEHPLDEEERLCNLIADSITPRLVPNIEMTTVEGKTLLVVEVFLSGSRPHWLKAEGLENGVYVRLGSTNRQADRELIAELHRSVEGIAFDELPMPGLSVDDLDLAALKALFRDRRDLGENDLLTLRLLIHDQKRLVPTKGGILLFGKERERYFPDAWVQCGRFMGKDKADIFDHIELRDHLPQAVDSIMLFLKKHAMRSADFSEVRRKDVWSIPLGILREVVINALVHTDYSQRGAPIRITFFDDRIEIENPGILLPGMTIEDMKQGISKIRNHVIARVFRELNLIEQWGSGIPRIFREAEELGLPDLQIMEIGMRIRFTVPLAGQLRVQESTEQVTEQVAEQVRRILVCLKDGPMGARAAMQYLGLRHRPTFLYDYLQPALGAGLVEMTQPESPKSPTQRYRLTQKGKAILAGRDQSESGQ
ncbi:MAG: helix-turn-helix domain-containing protein [Thermodesulfobacteriota bacterium]|nr:helix-turn-helix domain-containing protein [Thermodesulfobacteriota bacterium]